VVVQVTEVLVVVLDVEALAAAAEGQSSRQTDKDWPGAQPPQPL
jgi:hypothetical protein